jgi:WD40 repeat protein
VLFVLQMGHTTATPQQLQLTEDGTFAFSASGARKVIRWDMASGTPSLCLQQKQGSRTKCMHLSADCSIAVVLLYDSTMAVYDTRSGQLVCELMKKGERDAVRVHSGGVNGVLLTADGRTAISWSKDTTARLWDAATGACKMVLQVCAVDTYMGLRRCRWLPPTVGCGSICQQPLIHSCLPAWLVKISVSPPLLTAFLLSPVLCVCRATRTASRLLL